MGVLLYGMVACNLPVEKLADGRKKGLDMTTDRGQLEETFARCLEERGYPCDSQIYQFIEMLVQKEPASRIPASAQTRVPPSLAILDHPWLQTRPEVPAEYRISQESINEFRTVVMHQAQYQQNYVKKQQANANP
eukprot:gb/GECG01016437.1/.p1 GENE.gb/GECG01016437.1/~~gb/GECG01016437.1/.p1  ORF type:complete len:135 (+),score=9.48 gb/GECG01016437.1/:1-405(+)